MIRVVCGCGRVFKSEDRHSGKRTRCPVCGTGLTIGQTPASSTSEGGDLDEVPSWWFPADSGDSGDPSAAIPDSADPDAIRTEILPALEQTLAIDRRDEGGVLGTTTARPASTAPRGRRVAALAGGVAISALLATAALWSMRSPLAGGNGVAGANSPTVVLDNARGSAAPDRTGETRAPGDRQAAGGAAAEPVPPPRRLRLLVPAYIYPAGDDRKQWRRLIDAAAKVDLVVVVNPRSGPGLERNPNYAAVIAEAAERKVQLIGYVDLEFGDRQVTKIKDDIDAWLRFYPLVNGFFLDRQPCDAAHAAFVSEVSSYAREKRPSALLVGDPGQLCDDSFLSRAGVDVACIFARPEGFAAFELPANLRTFQPSQFAALVYQVSDAQTMHAVLKEAIIKRIGYIYVTDGKSPNPWAALPSYWEDEVEFVAKVQ